MISKSYPFLDIARQYNIDYGVVLKISELYKGGQNIFSEASDNEKAALQDIANASDEFMAIQDGILPFPST